MKRAYVAMFVVVAALGGALAPAAPAQAAAPAFVTLAFGRTQWVAAGTSCRPFRKAISLGRVAVDLADRGLAATGIVITDRTLEHEQLCYGGYALQASWDDIGMLHDAYGWSFVSGGTHDQDLSTKTSSEQWAGTCGSLTTFADHGLDASGMFAWPNDTYDPTIQTSIVSTCFDWGRRYGNDLNTPTIAQTPFTQHTWSLNGGYCRSKRRSCARMALRTGATWAYQPPRRLAAYVSGATPDTWAVVQAYRLVTGAKLRGMYRWDCRDPRPRYHWTNRGEIYCYKDYLAIVDEIGAGATVADPATVAAAWGRSV